MQLQNAVWVVAIRSADRKFSAFCPSVGKFPSVDVDCTAPCFQFFDVQIDHD
jgi:hypothetical protein